MSSLHAQPQTVNAAFVDLADIVASKHDVPEMLDRLCGYCIDFVDVTGAVGILTDEHGQPHVAATTSAGMARMVQPHPHLGHEPVSACVRSGASVVVPDVTHSGDGWPLASQAREQGVTSALLLPMRAGGATLGALVLLSGPFAALTGKEVDLCQALADAATAGMQQQQALDQAHAANRQLQEALDSRIVIEQAKGILACQGGISVDEAFSVLRGYARAHQSPLHDLASGVVNNKHMADEILGHQPAAMNANETE